MKQSDEDSFAGSDCGTADIHDDGKSVRRSVTIRRSRDDVERFWKTAAIPGVATFSEAPGDRGTEVRVEAPRETQSAVREIAGSLTHDDPGESLSTALREFKGRLETGEVATTKGQPSGREGRAD